MIITQLKDASGVHMIDDSGVLRNMTAAYIALPVGKKLRAVKVWEPVTGFVFTSDGYAVFTSDGYAVKCADQ